MGQCELVKHKIQTSTRKTSRNWTLEKRFISSHLQPPTDKNSKELANLISELDDVTVKTIYCVQKEVHSGVQFCTVPAEELLKSPFSC